MTDSTFDIENPFEEGNHQPDNALPKQLREMYEKEKSRREALENDLKSLTQKFRHSELSKALTAKGIPEKAVKFFPSDVEVTEESVTQWVEEHGSLFGPQNAPQSPATPSPAPTTPSTTAGPQEQAQGRTEGVSQMAATLSQVGNVVGTGTPANGAKNYAERIFDPRFCDEVPESEFREWLRSEGANV